MQYTSLLHRPASHLSPPPQVERVDHGAIPPKVEARLVDKDQDLEAVYQAFLEWAETWDVEVGQTPGRARAR